jgi:hypothetical protein
LFLALDIFFPVNFDRKKYYYKYIIAHLREFCKYDCRLSKGKIKTPATFDGGGVNIKRLLFF